MPAVTVGEWARGQVDAWRRTPRTITGPDGRAYPNPARAAARHQAESALKTVAAHLLIPPDEVGPCAACHAYHHRYGPGGRPLCPTCHTAATGRTRPAGRTAPAGVMGADVCREAA
ncbi:conserved hypothetical protein [Frankia sp. Hr75.2]|nr:conserved hypothetical protein [Frankia sp. Hr75.2]